MMSRRMFDNYNSKKNHSSFTRSVKSEIVEYKKMEIEMLGGFHQGRIKGSNGGNCTGLPARWGPRVDNYLFEIQYSLEKLSRFRSDTIIQIFRCCIK